MDAELFKTLFGYSNWARDRLLSAMDGLTEEDYAKANGFTYGSLRGIITHTISAEAGYLARWQGQPVERITAELAPDVPALAARWQQEEPRVQAFLSTLTDTELERDVVSVRRSGEEYRRPLWVDMMQILNHGTQHRSEAAEALTMIGRSPGDLDFSAYMSQRARQD